MHKVIKTREGIKKEIIVDQIGRPLKLKKCYAFELKNKELHQSFDGPHDQSKQENQDGNLVDPVHHAEIEVGRFVWVRFFENADEVISHLTQFEEFFDLVFLRHDTRALYFNLI
jgi:hypothetical protein